MDTLVLLPVIKPDRNKLEEAYELGADFTVTHGTHVVKVPKFFQFDGASIPALAWHSIGTPFNPRFMRASVVHDWLSYTHDLTRDQMNDLFHKMLRQDKVNSTKAWLMYQAVSAATSLYWNNDSDDDAYLKRLKVRITNDGRNPSDYGL